jgi:hypothetical protein
MSSPAQAGRAGGGRSSTTVPLDLADYLAALLIGGMGYGIYNQRRQAQILEAELSRLPAAADPAVLFG